VQACRCATRRTGAELFTGNTFVVTAAWFEGKCTLHQLARSLIFSWLGNFVGCLVVMALVVVGGTLAASPEYAMNVAVRR